MQTRGKEQEKKKSIAILIVDEVEFKVKSKL